MVADRVLGAIYLDTTSPTVQFDEDHLQVMTAVAGIASLAFDNVRHWESLRLENQELRAEIALEHNMVGGSPAMRKVFDFIRRVAPTDSDRPRSRARVGPGKSWWLAPFIATARAPTSPSWPSTAPPSPKLCWKVNCLATKRAPSPVPRH